MTAERLTGLIETLDRGAVLKGDDIGPRHYTDHRGEGEVRPGLVLRPSGTKELSRMLAACHAARQPVTVQGGMTGLVRAARPLQGEVAISLERMTAIGTVDRAQRSITAEAGAPLEAVQEAARAAGLFYPLDLGARGSCTIGGNISTNAGGNRVIRYGMTRELVLGLEAVLADGTILSGLRPYLKNNTGYDLKQLFIGSEGTLGIVTRAILRLFPEPQSQSVAVCAMPNFDAVTRFLGHMQTRAGADLSAFEVLWPETYASIARDVPRVRVPMAPGPGFYVLTETLGSDRERDPEAFETVLGEAFEAGLVEDAVIAKSDAEARALWDVRDGMAAALSALPNAVGFDISLAVSDMKDLHAELMAALAHVPGATVLIGGHLGDGNLHLAVAGSEGESAKPAIERAVYEHIGAIGGSVSAEHGIGMAKRDFLRQSRSEAEIATMRALKATLDPHGILCPGRIFEMKG